MATYWEYSCSFGLRYVSWYKDLIVSLFFSHLDFWRGNLFLIAPFPDLCLLVSLSNEYAQSMFWIKNKKKCMPLYTTVFKCGVHGGMLFMNMFSWCLLWGNLAKSELVLF